MSSSDAIDGDQPLCGSPADEPPDLARRRLLAIASAAAVSAVAAGSVPFIASLQPSARARAAGGPVDVDIGRLAPGEMMTVKWRGKPVWILRRTDEMLSHLAGIDDQLVDPQSKVPQQPDYAANPQRSVRPEYLVLVGICTHLGCSPSAKLEGGTADGMDAAWPGGFFCPCHGSKFDLAGRVFKAMPAPTNLEVPPHKYLGEAMLRIGEDDVA